MLNTLSETYSSLLCKLPHFLVLKNVKQELKEDQKEDQIPTPKGVEGRPVPIVKVHAHPPWPRYLQGARCALSPATSSIF